MDREGFPCGLVGKESARNAGDLSSILGLGRCPGEGKGYSLQYSGLENSMESQSQTGLKDFHFHFRGREATVEHTVIIELLLFFFMYNAVAYSLL